MSAERDPGTIDTWKGIAIKKMGRGDLEREFIALAIADQDRNARPEVKVGPVTITPLVPIDPQTARCLAALRDSIQQIEAGETVLRRFSDELADAGHLQRTIQITATFLPPKAAK